MNDIPAQPQFIHLLAALDVVPGRLEGPTSSSSSATFPPDQDFTRILRGDSATVADFNERTPCVGGCRIDGRRAGVFGVSGLGRVDPCSGFRWLRVSGGGF